MSKCHYQAFVRLACGNGEFSDWIGPITFNTSCLPVTELIENFDSQVSGTTGTFSICWGRITTATNGVYIIGSTVVHM